MKIIDFIKNITSNYREGKEKERMGQHFSTYSEQQIKDSINCVPKDIIAENIVANNEVAKDYAIEDPFLYDISKDISNQISKKG
jgi:hypothetical protein